MRYESLVIGMKVRKKMDPSVSYEVTGLPEPGDWESPIVKLRCIEPGFTDLEFETTDPEQFLIRY